MRPGISIEHALRVSGDDRPVRSDVAGFISIIPPARWPSGAVSGDFIELEIGSAEGFAAHPTYPFFDPATRRAVAVFFHNGGETGRVFGLCVRSEQALMDPAAAEELSAGLVDRLRGQEDVNVLCMPVLAYLPVVGGGDDLFVGATAMVALLLRHCRDMNNRFLLIDPPRHAEEAAVFAWARQLRGLDGVDTSYGALYFPWVMAGDESMPPSGAVAGVFARLDAEKAPFGVRWPPANQALRGVTHPAMEIPWSDSGRFAEAGVNPLLSQPGRGVVIWGGRTLSTDPRWLHINARRIVSFITERIRRDAEWVVFEHQRPELWETVGRMVRARLDSFWNAGLLTGETAGSEYLVQCDEELNPPVVRDAGQVHFRVLLRPVSTTEFIEVELRLGA